MHAETGGKKMDETVAAMVEIRRMLNISKLIENHNSDPDFHLYMHTVMSGGFDFEGSEVFIHTTTPHLWNADDQLKHILMAHSIRVLKMLVSWVWV